MLKPENLTPDELAALIDGLMASGTQHVNLTSGDEMRVQTVNSTDCCKGGACAIPTRGEDEEFDEGSDQYGK